MRRCDDGGGGGSWSAVGPSARALGTRSLVWEDARSRARMRRAPGTGVAAPRVALGAQPRGGTRLGRDARSSAPGAGWASPRVPASPRTRPRARLASTCYRVRTSPRGDPRRWFRPRVAFVARARAKTKSYLVERADVLRAGVGFEVLQDHLLDHQALLGAGIARCGRHGGAARGSDAAMGSTRSAICPRARAVSADVEKKRKGVRTKKIERSEKNGHFSTISTWKRPVQTLPLRARRDAAAFVVRLRAR